MSNKVYTTLIIIVSILLLTLVSLVVEVETTEKNPETGIITGEVSLNDPDTTHVDVELSPPIDDNSIGELVAEGAPQIIFSIEDSLLSPSNVTVEELEYSLRHELIPLASCFLEAEITYGVNACYLASIAGHESGWGRYQFRENNLFGFGQKSFDSPEDCIFYVAEFLSTEYLSEDGRYYGGGTTLYHVNKYYNGRQEWYDGVLGVYTGIINRINEYRG